MSDLGENFEHFQADGLEATERVRQQLARILDSRQFQRADALTRFLQFVVEETLAGRASGLKARSVAFKALGRPKDFDVRTDPIVRALIGPLRT
jgi:adenylate cyclase